MTIHTFTLRIIFTTHKSRAITRTCHTFRAFVGGKKNGKKKWRSQPSLRSTFKFKLSPFGFAWQIFCVYCAPWRSTCTTQVYIYRSKNMTTCRVTWLIHGCTMTHLYVCHDSFIRVPRLNSMRPHSESTQICDVPHLYVWHDSFVRVTMMTYSCVHRDSFICVWRDLIIRVTWLVQMGATTRLDAPTFHGCSDIWHDWLIRVTRFIHMCDMTSPCVRHDSLTCVPWLIHTCATTQLNKPTFQECSDMWRDSSIICVPWLNHMCAMTH